MKKIVDVAYDLYKDYASTHDIVIDFTAGQGNDTVKLARLVPHGHVYAFDIQQQALDITNEKLIQGNYQNVSLILDSHHHFDQYVQNFQIGIFNFGYLPSGNHAITTILDTSKLAVEKALQYLNLNGILILVLYPGHKEGSLECNYMNEYIRILDQHFFNIFEFKMVGKSNCPYIIGIEKIRE